MDGNETTREKLISRAIIWPNGLSLDLERGKLFWVDAELNKVEVANLDGTGRRILTRGNIGFPFALTNIGGWLYWSDWKGDRILATKKTDAARNVKVFRAGLTNPMGLKAYDGSKQRAGNRIATNCLIG